jgi:hypothetical protein
LKGKKVEVVNLYEFLKNLSENLVYMLKRIDFIAKKLGYGSDSLFPSEFMTTNEINANVAKLKGIKE